MVRAATHASMKFCGAYSWLQRSDGVNAWLVSFTLPFDCGEAMEAPGKCRGRFILIRIVAAALTNPIPEFLPLTSWGPVTIFTFFGVAGAVGVYALLRRFTANPARTFTIIAWVVLVVSLIPNLLSALDPSSAPIPGMTPAGALALALMHVPPALLTIGLLPRTR
jgi:hypothetical protein